MKVRERSETEEYSEREGERIEMRWNERILREV
jgi:hypothetical protein